MGAVIQAAAVHSALNTEANKMDQKSLCEELRNIMKKQEILIYQHFKYGIPTHV